MNTGQTIYKTSYLLLLSRALFFNLMLFFYIQYKCFSKSGRSSPCTKTQISRTQTQIQCCFQAPDRLCAAIMDSSPVQHIRLTRVTKMLGRTGFWGSACRCVWSSRMTRATPSSRALFPHFLKAMISTSSFMIHYY